MEWADRKSWVYVLIDPRTDSVRYVGISNNPQQRLRSHIVKAAKGVATRCGLWIRELLDIELSPLVREGEEVLPRPRDEEARTIAEKKWISHYRQLGCDLTNDT